MVTIENRQPAYSVDSGIWYWRLANKDATDEDVLRWPQPCLLPWRIYWGMTGSLGGYIAEYDTRADAMAALEHGLAHPTKGS